MHLHHVIMRSSFVILNQLLCQSRTARVHAYLEKLKYIILLAVWSYNNEFKTIYLLITLFLVIIYYLQSCYLILPLLSIFLKYFMSITFHFGLVELNSHSCCSIIIIFNNCLLFVFFYVFIS